MIGGPLAHDFGVRPGKGDSRLSDEELYARTKLGEAYALSQLYDRYGARIAAIARRFISDRQGIEEVVQDVFMRIWTTNAFTPDAGIFSHWICIVARRIAIDHARKRDSRIEMVGYGGDQGVDAVATAGQEYAFDSRLLHTDLMRALSALRQEEQVVLNLAYFEGKTLSEIAEDLNAPLGTVKTRLHMGLKHMRLRLADWRPEVRG